MNATDKILFFKESSLLKLPLILTIGRIFISPIFLFFYLYHAKMGISLSVVPIILLGLLGISELSDFLDGYLARKYKLVTKLGKILDPMADSITRLTILLTFTQGIIQLPLSIVFVFIYRDAMISTLRTVCAFRGVTLAARTSGKVKAVLQAVSILSILILMIFNSNHLISVRQLQDASLIIISLAALYTVFAGVEYIIANKKHISDAWKPLR